jgi:hypothetical protein
MLTGPLVGAELKAVFGGEERVAAFDAVVECVAPHARKLLEFARLRLVMISVTSSPTAAWLAGQVIDAFPWDEAPCHLLRDRCSPSAQVGQFVAIEEERVFGSS